MVGIEGENCRGEGVLLIRIVGSQPVFTGINFQIDIVQHLGGAEMFSDRAKFGTVAKLAMRQPFVLFKGLTFQKLCLPGAFRPGDHHNKM
ncbi:hypothetical protein, partial [Acinetobacter baumannii]